MATATTRHPAPPASPGTSRRRAGGVPRLFWVLWSGILINRLGTLVEPFLALYLVAVRGFPVAAAGGVLAVYALGSMISQLTGGVLADTLGRRATLTAGMLANAACLIALGYVTAAPAVIAMTFAAGVLLIPETRARSLLNWTGSGDRVYRVMAAASRPCWLALRGPAVVVAAWRPACPAGLARGPGLVVPPG